MKPMPQELEVWYLIPALRRELAKIFIKDYNLNQKKVADILGVTEPAISQYLKSKRAKEIIFLEKDQLKIKDTASEIIDNQELIMEKLYKLCVYFRGNEVICDIHREQDKSLPKNCDICLEH